MSPERIQLEAEKDYLRQEAATEDSCDGRDTPRERLELLYIAGPMSGLPDFNYPAFHWAAADLIRKGYRVINPADNKIALAER